MASPSQTEVDQCAEKLCRCRCSKQMARLSKAGGCYWDQPYFFNEVAKQLETGLTVFNNKYFFLHCCSLTPLLHKLWDATW